MEMNEIELLHNSLAAVKEMLPQLALLDDGLRRNILLEIADLTKESTAMLLSANSNDLQRMDSHDPKYDRLMLTADRIDAIVNDMRKVASLPSPLNKILENKTLPNGLSLEKITVPLGVVGVVYESRPNVTFDVFSICFMSGNATVLKGSRDAQDTNTAIVTLIQSVLKKYEMVHAIYLAPSDRSMMEHILKADGFIDVLIPRGSQSLIDYVRQNATIPVIETGAGLVHLYVDDPVDINMAASVITNSKARRVSVCNALDCLLVHKNNLENLHELLGVLITQYNCIVYADEKAYTALAQHCSHNLLFRAEPIHYSTEFLAMKLAVKIVENIHEAMSHISKHSSKHSEAILSNNDAHIELFLSQVDAAVVYANASTCFTDGGEFGMGAEIGISTQKLHARGPMALPELTSYKWKVRGNGQIR